VTIQLITPAPLRINNGNKMTALRWAKLLRSLGHKVILRQSYNGGRCDLLIALHARRSYPSIAKFHRLHANRPLIVALTGTDLYRDLRTHRRANRSLEIATRLVVLQKMALAELPVRLHEKTRVIYQSAEPYEGAVPAWNDGTFKVCVIGHLRKEKDPLRTALAARRLPSSSRINVLHIGLALDGALGERMRAEAESNPRYRWVGAWPHWKTRRTLASSHLLSLTSEMEGSSNVLSEAIASSVPVVATKIPGLMGTLGENYPGYFPLGNTDALADLLSKAETNQKFYRRLKQHCTSLRRLTEPSRERTAWKKLIAELR
jgi:putative glycosyltransferase (TIGR04348 family)